MEPLSVYIVTDFEVTYLIVFSFKISICYGNKHLMSLVVDSALQDET